ncbi:hypothetical protein [Devosia elaeis]|uniref:Uncharacterized protein n=1 Tax=Devosia elaeis TaxID=1770058 RepID=A0A178HY56_9HYPH|nr:hypothetical protein [Devosia elaeis]OAM77763.1 hypothetical protein A3840_08435 [Devosia elaeis]
MSAYFAVQYHDRIEIVTDGAYCAPSGELLRTGVKVFASPFLPLAFTGTGGVKIMTSIAGRMIEASRATTSVDGTIERLAQDLPHGEEIAIGEPFVAFFAGISETRGPCMWKFDAVAGRPELLPVYDSDNAGPGVTFDEMVAADLRFSDSIAESGVKLLDVMRGKLQAPVRGGPVTSWIGGHVDHTIVTASGVKTRQIHRWDDVVGERIRP